MYDETRKSCTVGVRMLCIYTAFSVHFSGIMSHSIGDSQMRVNFQ